MRSATIFLFAIFLGASLYAQPIADASYMDCNNNTETIYGVLGSGKVLVVANSGTNCSICQGHAPGIAGVANNNPNTIRVWGAMTTKNGGSVSCSQINSWVSSFGWTNVFSFVDSNKDWFNVATPQYTVVSPFDSTIAYQGGNWTTAKTTAENLANSIGIQEQEWNIDFYFANGRLMVELGGLDIQGTVFLYDITGAQLENIQVDGSGSYALSANLKSGIYLVRFNSNGRETIKKILL